MLPIKNLKVRKTRKNSVAKNTPIVEIENGTELLCMPNTDSTGTTLTNLKIESTEIMHQTFITLFKQVKGLEVKEKTISITASYWEVTSVGDTKRGVFLRFRTIKKLAEKYTSLDQVPFEEKDQFFENEGKLYALLEAFEFIASDSKIYLLAGTVAIQGMKSLGAFKGLEFEITYTGKNNRTKIFDIIPLM